MPSGKAAEQAVKKAVKLAAKKAPAKKTSKKLPKHQGKHHREGHPHKGKDLRRMYEHLGRLSALEEALSSDVFAQVERLTELAQHSLYTGESKCAADVLRACEHLSFGSLARPVRASSLGDDLEAAIEGEYEHLVDKAEARWKKNEGRRPAEIEAVYEEMLVEAEAAFTKGEFRRALEFARGAEALSHVRGDVPPTTESAQLEDSMEHNEGKHLKLSEALAARKPAGAKHSARSARVTQAGRAKQIAKAKQPGRAKPSGR